MRRAVFPLRNSAVAAALTLSGLAAAATYQVNSLADAGAGSLRQAVLDANASPGPDTIEFLVSGQIALTGGELPVSDFLIVNGPGADQLALDAGGRSRVFNLTSGMLYLSGLTIRNGRAAPMQSGGGILANGELVMFRCVVRNCQTQLSPGVNADGGGVYVGSGHQMTAEASLFVGNQVALGTGGAIRCASGAFLDARNCTFSGNGATQGGGLSTADPAALDFCTFADNSASSAGGGVWSPAAASRASNSIFFRNQAPNGPNWLGGIFTGGYNVVGVPSGSSGWDASDRLNLDPLLGPLTSLGGNGDCYPLMSGSPALDSANPSSPVLEDQRGSARPQRGQSDVGAYELVWVNQPPVASAGADQTVPSEGSSASVQLDGSGSYDPDDDDLTYAWFENGTPVSDQMLPTVTVSNGSHTFTLVVTDEWGASAEDSVTVTVEPQSSGDQRKPRIRQLRVNPWMLMPVDGNLRNVRLNFQVKDNNDPNPQVWLTVKSNQADSGMGPKDKPGDMEVVDKNNVKLRAEQFGCLRVYTVTVHAKDRDGNEATRNVRVFVPRPWHRHHGHGNGRR